MATQDRLIFKHNELDDHVYAYVGYTLAATGQVYEVFVGSFMIGSEQFDMSEDTDFLTIQDMKDIINKMEEYNA